MEEAKLITKVMVDNNHHAFARLVTIHQSQIRNYARRLCKGDLALADDIAQETFISAFEKIRNYKASGSFIGWLLTICYRHFLQHIRKYKAEVEQASVEQWVDHLAEPQLILEQAFSFVSADERSAITLNTSFGFTHQEISEIMKIPVGTVKSHISRGKIKLTEVLSQKSKGAA